MVAIVHFIVLNGIDSRLRIGNKIAAGEYYDELSYFLLIVSNYMSLGS
jgi:hypothetical protein